VVSLNTNGSTLDTIRGIFSGDNLTNLTAVAVDDDSGEGFASLIETTVVAGTAYHFVVDG